MTTYNEVFDEKQYRSVNLKAAAKYLDLDITAALPLITTDVFDAYEYLHPILDEATGVVEGIDYVEGQRKMNVRHEHEVIELFVTQGEIQIRNQDLWKYGEALISDKFDAKIEYLVKRVDDGILHGPKNDGGIQIAEGILGQLTCLIDQSSAGNASVATQGDIWLVLKKMIDDIPLAMRQQGPDMILYVNEAIYSNAQSPSRIYEGEMTEWDMIYKEYIGPQAVHGRKLGQVILTNKINAEASDDTNGSNADTVDILGTHGRMLLVVPDERWGGVIESAGFHKVGEEQGMLSVDMLYGWHGRGYVLDANAWNYTEALTF